MESFAYSYTLNKFGCLKPLGLLKLLVETSNARLRMFRYSFHIQMYKGFFKTKHYYRLLPEASFGLRVLPLPASVCVYQSLACPHDNSPPVQARITKFGPEKQNTLVKIPIVLLFFFFFFFWGGGGGGGGGNWPWPSRSNLTSNLKLTPFWACPNHYSPPILAKISKFGQQMHFSIIKIPGNSGLDWSLTSPSFLIPKLIYLHCGGVQWDCETVPGLFQCCSGTVS